MKKILDYRGQKYVCAVCLSDKWLYENGNRIWFTIREKIPEGGGKLYSICLIWMVIYVGWSNSSIFEKTIYLK